MADVLALAKLWVGGLSDPDASRENIAAVLADGVTTSTPLGSTEGKDAVLEAYGKSQLAPFIARGTWSEPVADGEGGVAVCTFPAGAPVGGIKVAVFVDAAGRIARVDTTMLPAAPPKPVAIALTDEIKAAINDAL